MNFAISTPGQVGAGGNTLGGGEISGAVGPPCPPRAPKVQEVLRRPPSTDLDGTGSAVRGRRGPCWVECPRRRAMPSRSRGGCFVEKEGVPLRFSAPILAAPCPISTQPCAPRASRRHGHAGASWVEIGAKAAEIGSENRPLPSLRLLRTWAPPFRGRPWTYRPQTRGARRGRRGAGAARVWSPSGERRGGYGVAKSVSYCFPY